MSLSDKNCNCYIHKHLIIYHLLSEIPDMIPDVIRTVTRTLFINVINMTEFMYVKALHNEYPYTLDKIPQSFRYCMWNMIPMIANQAAPWNVKQQINGEISKNL